LGCGSGHYSKRLHESGYEPVGIDSDEEMIRVAKSNCPEADFRCMNMLDIKALKQSFGAAFCIGNVLSHLNKGELRGFLAALSQKISPGGIWAFQIVNWDYILKHHSYSFPERTIESRNLVFARAYTQITEEEVIFSITLSSGGETFFCSKTPLHPLKNKELLDFHKQQGFELLDHFADYERNLFSPEKDSANIFVFRLK
jgi:2-polyprenyl-3-methyl-5-hydroxy-6-metoxy-1,4-benzoquinol methylase